MNDTVSAYIVTGFYIFGIVDEDFARSVPLDPTQFDERSFWWRPGVNISQLASPALQETGSML